KKSDVESIGEPDDEDCGSTNGSDVIEDCQTERQVSPLKDGPTFSALKKLRRRKRRIHVHIDPSDIAISASSKTRKKKQCPFCDCYVQNVPRHVREVHKRAYEHSRATDLIYRRGGKKDVRPIKTCPSCKKRTTRLDKHLLRPGSLGQP
ncbi:unnamed protein product, partial [Owenia fusiformis]